MDEQTLKNQYIRERMIVWLINPLELNLCQLDSSENNNIRKKFLVPNPEKGNCENLPSGKIYLEIETLGKNHH